MDKNESFGQSLKRERELRFITLKDVADATRISIKFLEAMENDNFEVLPAKTFIKGFLRNYAKFIGLDPEVVVTDYQKFISQSYACEPVADEPVKKDPASDKNLYLFIGSGILVCIIAVVIVQCLLKNSSNEQKTYKKPIIYKETFTSKKPVKTLEEPVVEPKPIDINSTEANGSVMQEESHAITTEKNISPPLIYEVSPLEKKTPSDPEKIQEIPKPISQLTTVHDQNMTVTENRKPPGEKINLQLTARDKTWIELKIDNGETFDLLFENGTSGSWTANEKFELILGNAGGVDLVFNGNKLTNLGKVGQVKRLLLTPDQNQ